MWCPRLNQMFLTKFKQNISIKKCTILLVVTRVIWSCVAITSRGNIRWNIGEWGMKVVDVTEHVYKTTPCLWTQLLTHDPMRLYDITKIHLFKSVFLPTDSKQQKIQTTKWSIMFFLNLLYIMCLMIVFFYYYKYSKYICKITFYIKLSGKQPTARINAKPQIYIHVIYDSGSMIFISRWLGCW